MLILNPDLIAPPDALSRMIAAAEAHGEPAVFGPALLRGGGTGRVASAGCFVATEDGLATGHMFAGEPECHLPKAPYEADFVTGAALLLSIETLRRIGAIPERYFLYFEESDWLTTAARKGVPSIVLPDIRLEHHKRSETGDLPARHFFYYYIRNAQIFARHLDEAGEGPDAGATLARIEGDFIDPWLARIGRAAPDRVDEFRALAAEARADGLAGRTGPVDLLAASVAEPALPPPDAAICRGLNLRFYTGGGKAPKLAGTLDLPPGADPAGPWKITVVQGASVVADGRATTPEDQPGDALTVEIPLPKERFRRGRGETLSLYLNGRKTGSVSAYIPQYGPERDGKFVALADYCCTGWLRNKTRIGDPLTVEIRCDGKVVGRGIADLPVNQGPCGFAIRLPRALFDGRDRVFELAVAGEAEAVDEATLSGVAGDPELLARPGTDLDHALFLHHEIWTGAEGQGQAE